MSDLSLGPDSPIPDKLYFKIGEVSRLVGVQAHVLRYWEKEISAIRPGKSPSKQRRYRHKDVEVFREIRRLLHEERYTLAGARRRVLSDRSKKTELSDVAGTAETLTQVPMGFGIAHGLDSKRLDGVKRGLRELIQLADA